MNQNDQPKFAEIMTILGAIYGHIVNEALIDWYFDLLKEYSIDEVKYAAQEVTKSKVYGKFPLPADFIEHLTIYLYDKTDTPFYKYSVDKTKQLIAMARERDPNMLPAPKPKQIEDDSEPRLDRTEEIKKMVDNIGKSMEDKDD